MKFQTRHLLPVFFAGSIFFHSGVSGQAWTIFNNVNSLLPQNTIRCITIDSQNRKWVGTDFGLGVYNDTSWTIYNTSNSGIQDNSIRSIAFDAAGAVWLGTFNSGAVKFDGTTWTQYSTSNSGIPDNFVKGIAFDTAGESWFATADGLAHYDGSVWQVWNPGNSPLLSPNIACITIGSNNIKYLGTFNGGMCYFDGDTTWNLYNHFNLLLPDNTVLAIALDSNGTRWAAMPAQGIIAHIVNLVFNWYNTTNVLPTNSSTHIMVDAAQKKYICSQDEGFIIFDGTAAVSLKTTNSPMPDDYALCTAKDHNGILWVGTYNGGLVRVDESQLTGVSEAKEISAVNLFPNPASRQLAISSWQLAIKEIEIIDVLGQLVFSRQPAASNEQQVINISSLSPGIYFLRIFSDKETVTKKFVKTN